MYNECIYIMNVFISLGTHVQKINSISTLLCETNNGNYIMNNIIKHPGDIAATILHIYCLLPHISQIKHVGHGPSSSP